MKLSPLLVLASVGSTSAFERYIDEDYMHLEEATGKHGRQLWMSYSKQKYFDKYLSIYDRCCGEDLSECKCPVREKTWFGIKKKWDKKCDTTIQYKSSITALALANDDFSTLVSLLVDADLASTLTKDSADGEGYTVFAPTNAAFEKLGDVDLTPEQLKDVLLYHVVAGTVTSDMLSDGQVVTTLNGQDLTIGTDGGVTINGDVNVGPADNLASNGVVHVIDTVLVPDLN